MMRLLMLSLICVPFLAQADVFNELTGQAARARTAEARKRRDTKMAELAKLNVEVGAKQAEIKKQKDLIVQELQSAREARGQLTSILNQEIARLGQQRAQHEALNQKLTSLKEFVVNLEKDMYSFSRSAVKVVAAAQSVVKMTNLIQASNPGALAWKAAYEGTFREVSGGQRETLRELAQNRGDLPEAVTYISQISREFLTAMDLESVQAARQQLADLRVSLTMQIEQSTSLLGATQKIQESYVQILEGLKGSN